MVIFKYKKLRIYFATMIIYYLTIILFLYLVGFWEIYLIKDTVIWFLVAAFVFSDKYVFPKNKELSLNRLLKEKISLVILVEFLVNTYTFRVLIEIILIFVLFIILFYKGLPKKRKERSIEKPLDKIQVFIGLIILAFVLYNIIRDLNQIMSIYYLKQITLPPILTITFIPFVIFWFKYSTYDLPGNNKNSGLYIFKEKFLRYLLAKTRLLSSKNFYFNHKEDFIKCYKILNTEKSMSYNNIVRLSYYVIISGKPTIEELQETSKYIINEVIASEEFNVLSLFLYDYEEFVKDLPYSLGYCLFTKDGKISEAMNVHKGDYKNMELKCTFKKKDWTKQPIKKEVEIWRKFEDFCQEIEKYLHKPKEPPINISKYLNDENFICEDKVIENIAKEEDMDKDKVKIIIEKINKWTVMDLQS